MTTDDQKSKHKPSGKVTLEDVLKSLQDMIHTDLLESEHVSQTPPAAKPDNIPREEKPPKEREAPAIEDFASPSPATGPVNLGAVMRTLKDLVNNELNVGDEASSSDNAGSASPELHEPEAEASSEIEASPADAEDDFLDSLASLSEDVSLPAPEAVSESASPAPEIEAVEFEAASEEIEAAPLPVDPSGMVQPDISEPDEIVLETETPQFKTEPEPIEAAALPFDTSDTTITPAGEILATSSAEGEAGQTEQQAPKSKRSGKNTPPGGLQHELLLDEAIAHVEAPTIPAPGATPPTVADSEVTPVTETPAPLEDTNIEMVSMESSPEPESPPEFLLPDAVLEIPDIENTQAPSVLDWAAMEIELDAPAQKTQNTPAIDFDAITLDEPSEESAPAVPEAEILSTESTPAPSAADTAVDEIKMETLTPQAMSMPSIDFNTASPEKPKEESQPAVPSSTPLALKDDSPMPSVEFSPSPTTPAKPTQETLSVAETKTPAVEPSRKPATAPVEPPKPPKRDDIPVLQDVVDAPAGKMTAKEPIAKTPSPTPDHARDAVIRAVAKLNIELRKAGGSGLDPKLINRLQQYMREELEKSTKKEE
jgi:hypothetical protein